MYVAKSALDQIAGFIRAPVALGTQVTSVLPLESRSHDEGLSSGEGAKERESAPGWEHCIAPRRHLGVSGGSVRD